ncbi:MAG: type II CAAX prenyl endopeptidase Rce1 family protein [Promethearchaeota archaeon]
MRKLMIVEIENSYLNLFTPAVIVAAGYFLFNLMFWLILLIALLLIDVENPFRIWSFITIFANFSVCVIIYLIIIPKLKIRDTEYKEATPINFAVVGLVTCMTIFSQALLKGLAELFDIGWIYQFPIPENLEDPAFEILYLFLLLMSIALFTELFSRRTTIPLLEDRGVRPVYAVILSSLGNGLIILPLYIIQIFQIRLNMPSMVLEFTSIAVFGFFAGITYIITRNILFPILVGFLYNSYEMIGLLGRSLEIEMLVTIFNLIFIISCLVTILCGVFAIWRFRGKNSVNELIRKMKLRSAQKIQRGIIGFFLISIGLLVFQALAVIVVRHLTDSWNNPSNLFPGYVVGITIFYLIASVIPFFLTVSTEYARD